MREKTKDDYLYITLLITCMVILVCTIFFKAFSFALSIPHCFFWEHFGIYCPGCGCTRAFECLLHLDILHSVYYNPAVLYFVCIMFFYLFTQTLDRICHRSTYTMPYSNVYVYIGITILIINCIVRDVLLWCFHIPL